MNKHVCGSECRDEQPSNSADLACPLLRRIVPGPSVAIKPHMNTTLTTVKLGPWFGDNMMTSKLFKDSFALQSFECGYVKSIGQECFMNCVSLTTCNVRCENIFVRAFFNCINLPQFNFFGVSVVGYEAFARSAIQVVVTDANLRVLGLRAFENCASLRVVALPSPQLLELGDRTFAGAECISQVVLPSNLARMGKHVFTFVRLIDMDCPPTLSEVHPEAMTGLIHTLTIRSFFCNWKSLTRVQHLVIDVEHVPPEAAKDVCYNKLTVIADSVGHHAFESAKCKEFTLCVKRVHEFAFLDFEIRGKESSLVIPQLEFCGQSAFEMLAVDHVSFAAEPTPGSTPAKLLPPKLFSKSGMKTLDLSNYPVEQAAERWCSRCYALSSVILPKSLEHIGNNAFEWCTELKEIEIPELVETVCNNSFSHCSKLRAVVFAGQVEKIGYAAFSYSGLGPHVVLPDSVQTIDRCAFSYCGFLKTFETTAKMIHSEAFESCYLLQRFKFHGEKLEDEVFVNCSSLRYVEAPVCTMIGKRTFRRCMKLEELRWLSQVVEIGAEAFLCCTSIGLFRLGAQLDFVAYNAFFHTDAKIIVEFDWESAWISNKNVYVRPSKFVYAQLLQQLYFNHAATKAKSVTEYGFHLALCVDRFMNTVVNKNPDYAVFTSVITNTILIHLRYTELQ